MCKLPISHGRLSKCELSFFFRDFDIRIVLESIIVFLITLCNGRYWKLILDTFWNRHIGIDLAHSKKYLHVFVPSLFFWTICWMKEQLRLLEMWDWWEREISSGICFLWHNEFHFDVYIRKYWSHLIDKIIFIKAYFMLIKYVMIWWIFCKIITIDYPQLYRDGEIW